jgi:pSer/pThr/pTyr-binding forkhead associated (FHA) protein
VATGWEVVDLGSINGTQVNGTPVTAPTPLRPGDELCLAEAVRFVAEAVDVPARAPLDVVPLPATVAIPASAATH